MKIRRDVLQEAILHEPEIRRNQIEAMCRKASKALNSSAGLKESDPAWLWTLKIKGFTALEETHVRQAFIEAVEKSLFDSELLQPSTRLKDEKIKEHISKVEWALLEFWLAKEGAELSRSLCYYNDNALAKLVDFLFGFADGHYSEQSIRKVWERLGLKKSPKLLFRDVDTSVKPVMPVPYKVVLMPD